MSDKFLYLALGDDTKKNKAPSLRMAAMKKGFRQLMHEENLIEINGTVSSRNKKIKDLIFNKKLENVTAAYIESSNVGMAFWDAVLIFYLKYKRVKMSVFIRDFYPLFINGWKDTNWKGKIANILWFINIFVYRLTVSISYFPSDSSKKLLNFRFKDILPPGLFLDIPDLPLKRNTVFYAGGLRKPYNLEPVLEAVDLLNKELKVKFNVFCREDSLPFISKWLDKEWLVVEHKSLYDLDYKPHIAVISSDNSYQAIARSVKMLDYIKLGSPIIISDAYENSKFLNEHEIGLVAEPDNSDSFYNQLKKFFTDDELSTRLRDKVMDLQKSPELNWSTRCEKVLEDLGKDFLINRSDNII